jgi:hypothetical protein
MSRKILTKDKAQVANIEDAHVGVVRNLLESCDALASAKFAFYVAGQCPVEPTEEMKGVMDAIDVLSRKPDSRNSVSDLAVRLKLLMPFDEKSLPAALRWASKATVEAALALLTYSQDEGTSAPLGREYALKAYCFALKSVESAARESAALVPPGHVHESGGAVRQVMAVTEERLIARLGELAHPKPAVANLPEKRGQ